MNTGKDLTVRGRRRTRPLWCHMQKGGLVVPPLVRLSIIGMVLFVGISAGLGYTVQRSPLYNGWIWAGTFMLVVIVSMAGVSWTGVVRSPWKAVGLAVATPLLYFTTLLATSLLLPDAYLVQVSGDLEYLEHYDVGIVIELGGLVAVGLSTVLAVAKLLQARLRGVFQ